MKTKMKVKGRSEESLTDRLNQVPDQDDAETQTSEIAQLFDQPSDRYSDGCDQIDVAGIAGSDEHSVLFDALDRKEFEPNDFNTGVAVDSLESAVGYSSLIRQMQEAFFDQVAFYRSEAGGSLSVDEARTRAFHVCENEEQAKALFDSLMNKPLHSVDFNSLSELYAGAPRVAERMWEMIKTEGRAEFESGHLAANTMFPVPHMKQAWNIARFLGVRESFIDDWNPQGGTEVALIDMLAQTYFQWQYWVEQVVLRSETRPRAEHPDYVQWKQWQEKKKKTQSWSEGYWFPQYIAEQSAIDHAVQTADRFNRIFMRTLRQLRDLRRYSPVTINSPQQVNIAAHGGQQVNVGNNKIKKPRQSKRVLKND
jgi:hypothetical protein